MNEELISLKTALLAKRFGIKYRPERCFAIDRTKPGFLQVANAIDIHVSTIDDSWTMIAYRYSQSILAKILREKYNVIVIVDYGDGFNGLKWHYKIIKKNKIITNAYYSTYEEALKFGIDRALEDLIMEKEEIWKLHMNKYIQTLQES